MRFDKEYFSLGYFDTLSYGNTVIHRLDPRAKVISTLAFIIAVVSFPKYAVTALLPFFLFPAMLMVFADIPFYPVFKKVVLVSPFAVFMGILNPFLDAHPLLIWNGLAISAGWISFSSILIKFSLTISAALILIATTSFPGVCFALGRLRLPQLFISQLLFIYRYLFVLMEEAMRIIRAHEMRSFSQKKLNMRMFIRLISILFIRTIERAERIFQAMLARGFSGEIRPTKTYAIKSADVFFAGAVILLIVLFRAVNITSILGILAGRLL